MTRVLVLTHRLPYAPNRGDRLRAYHMLQHLRDRADVELVSLIHDDEEAGHLEEMRTLIPRVTGVRVPRLRTRINGAIALATRQPLTHALLDAPEMTSTLREICDARPPDVVFAYCSGMAKFALRPPLDRIPMVLDFVDVDSRKWRDLSRTASWPKSWIYQREATALGAFERRAAEHAASSLVVNAREADIARELAPSANVQVLLNGVELERLRPRQPPESTSNVVFCGVMNYSPNHEGMTWFVKDIWPLVRMHRPDATLSIVGPHPLPSMVELCGKDRSITLTGWVDDVREWLWSASVAIAPLQVARGVQNKALEAIASGLPIVMTEAVAGGLPPQAAYASLVANTPARFADHVLDLLGRSPTERRAMATAADLGSLTWSRTLEKLWQIIEDAAHTNHQITKSQDHQISDSTDLSPNFNPVIHS